MQKTELMLEVEKRTGLNLESYLPLMYKKRWRSGDYLGKMILRERKDLVDARIGVC